MVKCKPLASSQKILAPARLGQTLQLQPRTSNLCGAKSSLEGFIVLDENCRESTFMITRFAMACCAADARPIALPVH